jgi:hypothetical protein
MTLAAVSGEALSESIRARRRATVGTSDGENALRLLSILRIELMEDDRVALAVQAGWRRSPLCFFDVVDSFA